MMIANSKYRPRWVGLATVLAAATTLAAGAAAAEGQLHILNWSDYIAEDTIENFEAETGIDVIYDVFDSNEVLEGKLLAGNTGYDLVVPTGSFLERQVAVGIFQPLDRSRLTNYGNLNGEILERVAGHDPGNAHAIPYMWGT
ncbi:MAG: spermidine/putrescine ABC transporter substrate-binding protein PotF, partial [Inquilinus sp.]|nr:spermidine/putrescine ABC transporter substrate-binding protein PotF [Inquilinus sp.]